MARSPATFIVVSATTLLIAGAAQADAIDGDWCKEAAQFSIAGPQITTPAGTLTRGDYDRHAFHYVDEDGGFAEGAEIRMRLLNEETVRVFVGTPDTDGEIWQRCEFTS